MSEYPKRLIEVDLPIARISICAALWPSASQHFEQGRDDLRPGESAAAN
ncbi:MAG: hypothetical protein ACREJM_03975 [Candidatus Saccharimonadales bacterium]